MGSGNDLLPSNLKELEISYTLGETNIGFYPTWETEHWFFPTPWKHEHFVFSHTWKMERFYHSRFSTKQFAREVALKEKGSFDEGVQSRMPLDPSG